MARFQYEVFQVLDMQVERAGQVTISLLRSDHLHPGDELDLTPYGAWRIVAVEDEPSSDITTVHAVHLPE